ncbi:integral peroxisomal membrane protein [Rhizodiscina lignyota]|uniref:Integral peroxisomal membrane protein n=1 Tax=Rhizodiscina lignyota TaxID=1504668 RepID=A0A9P4I906_9PEZI|nr:integral peroxisomal membrane protein [Rhizodiscina lignyota]
MSSSTRDGNDASSSQNVASSEPPTYAAFSPATLGHPTIAAQRSTILVHQKSPLLVATPPQITRALAYSHPFIVPLNKLAGLLSWTTGDPWESFLLVAAFWAVALYGDIVIRWAGPIVMVSGLILGMYARRYSLLSSTGWTGEKGQKGHKRGPSDPSTHHHKSLDEIVDELKLFTSRCNILLDPALRLTDFLSTQRTATSATTRPALTALFIRILFVSPIWFALTLPPFYFITTKRVILAIGTISLSWHSRPARVSRTILWRSRTVRRACAAITGLHFSDVSADGSEGASVPPSKVRNANEIAASLVAKRKPSSPGIRFTFTLYENQRRWLGIGWTSSMLAYERASWTDEELNPSQAKDQFALPEVEGGHARWRWVEGSQWHVEGIDESDKDDAEKGWVYYDNKWRNGRRDKDGWGRYTRRRKWCRDAELVEVTPSTEITPSPTPKVGPSGNEKEAHSQAPEDTASLDSATSAKKRRWFRRSSGATTSDKSAAAGSGSGRSVGTGRREEEEEDVHSPLHHKQQEHDWGIGDEARMGLG